jgi:hypothetical protein
MSDFSEDLSFGQVWIDEYGNELKIVSVKDSEVKLITSGGFIVTRDVYYLMCACECKGD